MVVMTVYEGEHTYIQPPRPTPLDRHLHRILNRFRVRNVRLDKRRPRSRLDYAFMRRTVGFIRGGVFSPRAFGDVGADDVGALAGVGEGGGAADA